MQFPFAIEKMVKLDPQGFGKIDKIVLGNNSEHNLIGSTHYVNNNSSRPLMLKSVIDTMGELSAKSQGLKAVITQYSRILSDQTIYIKAEGNQVQGFIKVGIKSLFHRDYTGNIKELRPLCVLDFYVHESVQRNGFGKVNLLQLLYYFQMIFNYMLEQEMINPSKIAYDRPSKLLFSFLRKHFNLVNYIPQNNNFVIFNQYFEANSNKYDQISQTKPQQAANEQIITQQPRENIDQQQFLQQQQQQQQQKQDIEKQLKLSTKENQNFIPQPNNLNFFSGESTDYYQKYNKMFQNNIQQNNINMDNQVQKQRFSRQAMPLQNVDEKITKTEEKLSTVTERIKQMQLQQNYAEEFKNLQTNKKATPWATNQITIPMQTQSQQYGNFYTEKFNKPYF